MPERILCMTFALLLLSACAEPAVDHEAEEQRLMDLSRSWSAMVGRGELEASIELWADDAVMLPPGEPLLRGKEEIRDFVTRLASVPGFRISWEPLSAEISASGDMGYLIEKNIIEVDTQDGEKLIIHGKVVTVWRKGPDGQWLNVVVIWNTAPEPTD